MERVRIKYDTPIFVEEFNGKDIFKQHPSKDHGYDPAFVIYYTKPKTGRMLYEHFGYSLEDIKGQIGNRFSRPKRPTKRKKLNRRKV